MLDDAKIPVMPEGKKKKSKRKKPDVATQKDGLKDLRERAKYHCKSVEDWRVVSKYPEERLKQFMDDLDYVASHETYEKVSEILTHVFAYFMDRVTKGEGEVEKEIKNDISLRNCVHKELVEVIKIVSNRMQIGFFTMIDILEGKKKQHAISMANSHHSHDNRDPNNFSQNMEQRGGDAQPEPAADSFSATHASFCGTTTSSPEAEGIQGFDQQSTPHNDSAWAEGLGEDEPFD